MDFFVDEVFFVKDRWGAGLGVFPSGDVLVFVVVAAGFTGLGLAGLDFGIVVEELVLGAEVAAARFFAVEGVVAEDFGEFNEVGDAACFFEFDVEAICGPGDADVGPEFVADRGNLFESFLKAGFVALHAALVPDEEA